jgi:hypothetical protein
MSIQESALVSNNQQIVENNQQIVENENKADEGNEDNPFGPIWVDGNYNPKAHHYHVEKQFERDLNIQKIVDELGEEVCNFVEIETKLGGTQLHMTFHPNPTAEIDGDLEWITLPSQVKGNAGRYYREISNKRIFWFYKVLSGDIFSLIQTTFEKDLVEALYTTDLATFSKKVAKFILDYPHKDFTTYGCYLLAFIRMIELAEPEMSHIMLQRIAVAISANLKRVADYKDQKSSEHDLYIKIRDISTKLTTQNCSKSVHYKISLIDINAQKASLSLAQLDKEADKEIELERHIKQKRMDDMKNSFAQARNNKQKSIEVSKKRKVEEIEPEKSEVLEKKQRIEEVECSSLPSVQEDVLDDIVKSDDNNNEAFERHLEKRRREEAIRINQIEMDKSIEDTKKRILASKPLLNNK